MIRHSRLAWFLALLSLPPLSACRPDIDSCAPDDVECLSSSGAAHGSDRNRGPKVSFLEPQAGAKVQGIVLVRGTALDESGQPVPVQLSLDSEALTALEAQDEWIYRLDTRRMKDGVHVLSARATDRNGAAREESLSVQTQKGDLSACPEGHLVMQYFKNDELTGAPALTRCDSLPIDYDWDKGGPEGPAEVDRFSVSWTGRFTSTGGTKVFRGQVDDGVRLWVDGVPLVDEWRSQPLKTFEVTRTLSAGSHEIQVDYFEGTGAAIFRLRIDSTS